MAYDDEKSNKPREMVHRAQARSTQRLHEYRLALHGEPGAPRPSTAARRLHVGTMLYFEQIKRFAAEERLEDLWHNETAVEIDGTDKTLDELQELRLTQNVRVEQQIDPETNATEAVEEREPWRLSPQQALSVNDKLDQCANSLGFDARPTRDADTTGVGADDDAPDSADEMEHVNSEVNVS